jgi:hypothetical protein
MLNNTTQQHETIPMDIEFQTPPKILPKDSSRMSSIIPGPTIRDRIIALNLAHQRHKHKTPPVGGICMIPKGGFKWKRPRRQPATKTITTKTGMMKRLLMYKHQQQQRQHIMGPRHAMNPANNNGGGQTPINNEGQGLSWKRRGY